MTVPRRAGTLRGSASAPDGTRRLVVWISAGILGFQGGTLALDLINCTVLSWLWVERHGLEQV